MIKLSQRTVALLAAHGDKAAKFHLGFNRFLMKGGYVTNYALDSLNIARVEARMNSMPLGSNKNSVELKLLQGEGL